MDVLIDSNVIIPDYWLTGSIFAAIKQLRPAGHKLCIPRLVLDEVQSNFARDLWEAKRKADEALKGLGRISRNKAFDPLTNEQYHELKGEYAAFLEGWCKTAEATILEYADYDQVEHATIVRRAIDRAKPFKDKGVGYRDYLIWQNVLQLAAREENSVAFVTKNKSDFGEDGHLHADLAKDLEEAGHLHADLAKDLEEAGHGPDSVRLFSSLEDFFESEVRPTLRTLQSIVETGGYQGFDLVAFIRNVLPYSLGGNMNYAQEEVLYPDFHKVHIVSVLETEDVKITDAVMLPSGEFYLSVEAMVEAEISFGTYRHGYRASNEELRSQLLHNPVPLTDISSIAIFPWQVRVHMDVV